MADCIKRCFDCAYCSTYVYRQGDCCDLDEHCIENVFTESCEEFIMADEETDEFGNEHEV